MGGLLAAPLVAALPSDPADFTISQAIASISDGRLTPLELTEACLSRISKHNTELNALIAVLADQARAHARSLKPSADFGRSLHGIPVALKDVYDTAGIPTTAASAQWRNRVPDSDAVVVRRLRTAGSVLVGKANLDEFAYNFTSKTVVFGASRNPWNRAYSPGGSSGGSAIAVSTGMCLGALGSDTGGAIRLPAAFCGVTGHKPTYGSIPVDGVTPLAWSLDTMGPLTRTAQDAALLHQALSGQPLKAVAVRDLRPGLIREPFMRNMDGDAERVISAAVGVMRRFTHHVREIALPALPTAAGSPAIDLHHNPLRGGARLPP